MASVRQISRCTIKPKRMPEDAEKPCNLTPWDLSMLTGTYMQQGLLFSKPPSSHTITLLLHTLKDSLSSALVHFFPLAGRLATKKDDHPPSYTIFIDCTNAPGAEFIHAVADVTIADIITPIDVPTIVNSMFPLDGAVNHDGHTMPLLSVQVTELVDGIFFGCSFNHVVGDGASFWHFLNVWSEICRSRGDAIDGESTLSRPPIIKRWFPDGHGPNINLPFSHPDEFIDRFTPPVFRERIFHFSSLSIAQLKAKANQECNTDKISSFQSLCALLWRSMIRARHLPSNQTTRCLLTINNRSRLHPPLSPEYLGNCVHSVCASATAGELVDRDLGCAAWLLHQGVVGHNDGVVRKNFDAWVKTPTVRQIGRLINKSLIMIAGSPRFDAYGNDFGWGKPVAVRRGSSSRYDGKVASYPGRRGGGSVDVDVCLLPQTMSALESDEEFMGFVVSES